MDNRRIKVTELDFDQIKENIKEFLRGQSDFTDYDYEGSALSILIDVLAFNTHYNAMYAHLALNESFLDSAAKRNSVVSHAKSLGYFPYSARAARALVNIVVSNPTGNPDTLTLPANHEFTATTDDMTYTFYNKSAATISRNDNLTTPYLFENIELVEGTNLRNRYEVGTGVKYIIPNSGADISTLVVTVQESTSSASYTIFTYADNFTAIGSDDAVYFVKEIDDELYEVYFGDGVTGKQLNNGNVVTLSYMVCNKSAANKCSSFNYNGNIGGGTPVVITLSASAGGAEMESIDSIKLNAPRNYSAQNRAVTAEDYKTILPQLYQNIESLNVWGGEENDPPQYGKVFIAIKPKVGEVLNITAKQYIKTALLSKRHVVGIIPVIVDPEYVYITLQSNVYYNPLKTDKSAETIKGLVVNAISNYDINDLRQFGGLFRYSKLSRLIDQADTSITSNITNIRMSKLFTPVVSSAMQYTINYGNPIYNKGVAEESIRSSGFYVLGIEPIVYLDDDGLGNIRMFYINENNVKVFVLTTVSVGSVNYTTGKIILNNTFTITATPNNKITIYCVPDSNDILSLRDQLVVINQQEIKVNVVIDKVSSGQYSGGSEYIFSSSHNYTV